MKGKDSRFINNAIIVAVDKGCIWFVWCIIVERNNKYQELVYSIKTLLVCIGNFILLLFLAKVFYTPMFLVIFLPLSL